MDVFTENDYKRAVRARVKERRGLTLRKVAARVPMQYTHLSRVLSSADLHLGERHLFAIARHLDFFPDEIDFLLLLRAHAMADSPSLREHYSRRLERLRRARVINAPVEDFHHRRLAHESAYLLDPLCVLLHVGLTIDRYFENPQLLCAPLGVSARRLREMLETLAALDFVELADDTRAPVRLLKGKLHYGTDHPLMRAHQSMLRDAAAARVNELGNDEKHSFMVTLSSNPEVVAKIRERFQVFIREAEALTAGSRRTGVYQMGFDLFGWF